MNKWWVIVVSGRTAGEGQQQQQPGNASRTFTAGGYLVSIFSYYIILLTLSVIEI